jgi:glyoxylase-like metal-dependent hydrolase (beta-lactamase superfamily II)
MTVSYSCTLLRAGEFRLEGGSMFGVIPRVVWGRTVPIDERGRITVQHNCLLLERHGEPTPEELAALPIPHAPRLVLIEVGTGNKLDAKSRDVFAMGERSILDALHDASAAPRDIGAVITTHLHFDHSGGLTRLCTPGETPDWTGPASSMAGSRGEHSVKRTFPNAKIYTQAREWSDAIANRSVMTRTYFKDHLEPIREQAVLVHSAPPFAPGVTPDRDEQPAAATAQRRTRVLPGIDVMLVPGHTWGQQAILFQDTKGRTVVFTPDVLPTAAHLGAAYSLAYDVEPYTSMVSKRWFLESAAEENWVLVLDHEVTQPVVRARPDGKGWFALEPEVI